eukprot:174532-Chlamydomonas_euryale.AAC.2
MDDYLSDLFGDYGGAATPTYTCDGAPSRLAFTLQVCVWGGGLYGGPVRDRVSDQLAPFALHTSCVCAGGHLQRSAQPVGVHNSHLKGGGSSFNGAASRLAFLHLHQLQNKMHTAGTEVSRCHTSLRLAHPTQATPSPPLCICRLVNQPQPLARVLAPLLQVSLLPVPVPFAFPGPPPPPHLIIPLIFAHLNNMRSCLNGLQALGDAPLQGVTSVPVSVSRPCPPNPSLPCPVSLQQQQQQQQQQERAGAGRCQRRRLRVDPPHGHPPPPHTNTPFWARNKHLSGRAPQAPGNANLTDVADYVSVALSRLGASFPDAVCPYARAVSVGCGAIASVGTQQAQPGPCFLCIRLTHTACCGCATGYVCIRRSCVVLAVSAWLTCPLILSPPLCRLLPGSAFCPLLPRCVHCSSPQDVSVTARLRADFSFPVAAASVAGDAGGAAAAQVWASVWARL